jgi:TrmH family RNA methyltransferase
MTVTGADAPPTSALANPRAARVKAVRRLTRRAGRERARRFLAEGPQAVREAIVAHAELNRPVVHDLFVTTAAADRHAEILAQAAEAGLEPVMVSDQVLGAMTETVTPQGMLAVCAAVDRPLAAVLDGLAPTLVAVLAQVRDPGNAGTVLRTADAAGADAVILSDASVDVHNAKCVRATAGSIFHLPVVQGVPLEQAVAALRARGLAVLAADGDGDVDLDDLLDEADRRALAGGQAVRDDPSASPALLSRPTAWLFGNEAWGLADEHRGLADAVVRVPIHGRAESLNLATAATVCLYASARAQRARSVVHGPMAARPTPGANATPQGR